MMMCHEEGAPGSTLPGKANCIHSRAPAVPGRLDPAVLGRPPADPGLSTVAAAAQGLPPFAPCAAPVPARAPTAGAGTPPTAAPFRGCAARASGSGFA